MKGLTDSEKLLNQQFMKAFDYLLDNKEIFNIKSEKVLCTEIGIYQTNLSKYRGKAKDGKDLKNDEIRPIPITAVINLINKYNINSDYLLLGKGDIFETSDILKEPVPAYHTLKILPVTVDDHGNENIVMVNTKAQAGYPSKYLEPEYYKHLPLIKFPHPKLRNATFRGFEIEGDSMEPTFHHGSVVLGRYIEDWHHGNIREGYVYVVVTREKVFIKRVLNRLERDELYLMSDNESYQGFPISTKEDNIQEMWYVEASLSFKFPNVRYDWRRKMSHMEADIHDLKIKLDQVLKQK